MFDFEKFSVYQKAEQIYADTINLLQDSSIDKSIKDQFRRSSLSIVLNIAEGAGKYTKSDKKNYYITSKGSVYECVALLRILKIENKISVDSYAEIYLKLLEVSKMLSGLINEMIKRTT